MTSEYINSKTTTRFKNNDQQLARIQLQSFFTLFEFSKDENSRFAEGKRYLNENNFKKQSPLQRFNVTVSDDGQLLKYKP